MPLSACAEILFHAKNPTGPEWSSPSLLGTPQPLLQRHLFCGISLWPIQGSSELSTLADNIEHENILPLFPHTQKNKCNHSMLRGWQLNNPNPSPQMRPVSVSFRQVRMRLLIPDQAGSAWNSHRRWIFISHQPLRLGIKFSERAVGLWDRVLG